MPRPITDTLRRLHGGTFLDKATDALGEVVRSVQETGKPGKVTITIDVKKAGAGAASVLAKLTHTVAEKQPDAELFYATEGGDLTVNNPKQGELDLREVSGSTGAVKTVENGPSELRQAS